MVQFGEEKRAPEKQYGSTLEEAFENVRLPLSPGPTLLWRLVEFRASGLFCADLVSHPIRKQSG